jgi:hypothetical protein
MYLLFLFYQDKGGVEGLKKDYLQLFDTKID